MNNSVGVSFSNDASLGDSDGYWVHVEQVLPENSTSTLGEVAELVNVLFGIDTCDEYDAVDTTPITEEEDYSDIPEGVFRDSIIAGRKAIVAQEKLKFFQEQIKKYMKFGMCDKFLNTGDFKAQLKIGKSHQEADYKLVLQTGRIIQTEEVKARFSKSYDIKDGSGVTLNFPVVDEIDAQGVSTATFEFENVVYGRYGYTPSPTVTRNGRELSWSGPVTGVLVVSYVTRYDIVDVIISGNAEGESETALALCFYKGTVDESDVVVPDADGEELDKQTYCDAISSAVYDVAENDDVVECYQDVRYNYVCKCSPDTIAYHRDVREVVTCPSSDMKCTRTGGLVESADGKLHCDHYMGSRTVIADYVSCDTPLYNNQWGGFATNPELDGVSDPEYYEEICCVPPDDGSVLPVCSSLYEKNNGQPLDEDTLAELESRYGERLKLIPVSPEGGDCGYVNTVVGVKQQNCCEEVDSLQFGNDDYYISPGGSFLIDVYGGKLPLTWKGSRNLILTWSEGYYARFTATEDFCGTGSISATDGCSSAVKSVSSTAGHWESIDAGVFCGIPFDNGLLTVLSGHEYDGIYASSRYRIYVVSSGAGGAGDCTSGLTCPSGTEFLLPLAEGSIPLASNYDYCRYREGTSHFDKRVIAGCCEESLNDSPWLVVGSVFHYAHHLEEWKC